MTRRMSSRGLIAAALVLGAAACAPPGATRSAASSPQATRVIPWSGGDRLWVGVYADVRYVQGADAKVEVSGPKDEIDDIVVDGGAIRHERWSDRWSMRPWPRKADRLRIVVTAPAISSAGLGGAGRLDLGRLHQDRLELQVSGAGRAEASGEIKALKVSVSGAGGAYLDSLQSQSVDASLSGAGRIAAKGTSQEVRLSLSGAGHADLEELAAQHAFARASGSGTASLAPSRSADITVSGAGGVRLATDPADLKVHRSGAGWVRRSDGRRAEETS